MKWYIGKKTTYKEIVLYTLLSALCISLLLIYPLKLKIPILLIFLSFFIIFIYNAAIYYKEIDYFLSFLIISVTLYNFSNLPLHPDLDDVIFPLLSLIYFFLLLGWIFSGRVFDSKIRFKSFSSLDKLLLSTFLALFLISSIFFNWKDFTTLTGITKLFTIVTSFYFFFYYLPNKLLLDERNLIFLLRALGILGIITAFVGIITLYVEILPINMSSRGSAVSFFQHPNATASIYNFSIPAILFLLIKKRELLSKFEINAYYVGLAISFIGLFFTFSRSSIISILMVVLFFMYNYSKKAFITVLIITPIVFFVLLADFLTSKGTLTAVGRLGLLATTIEMIQSSQKGFYWGFGTISTVPIFHSFKVSLQIPDPNDVPHNVFIFYILQFGIISFIPLFIYLMKLYIYSVYKFMSKRANDFLVLSLSICIPMLFKNMFEDLVFFPQFVLFYLFLLFLGIMNISNKGLNVVKI